VPLADVRSVEVADRRPVSHFFAAGIRRHLRVNVEGESRYFVVRDVDALAAELAALTDAQ